MNYYKRNLGKYTRGWHLFDAFLPWEMPPLPACYAIYLNGSLVYIGQSVDLRNRFHLHKFRHGYANEIITPWGECQRGTSISVKANFSGPFGYWAMREIRLIRRLNPQFNVHHRARKKIA